MRETKRAYGWPEDAQFLVPDGVREHFADGIGKRGAELRDAWERSSPSTDAEHAELAAEIDAHAEARAARRAGTPTSRSFAADAKGIATRKASRQGR